MKAVAVADCSVLFLPKGTTFFVNLALGFTLQPKRTLKNSVCYNNPANPEFLLISWKQRVLLDCVGCCLVSERQQCWQQPENQILTS